MTGVKTCSSRALLDYIVRHKAISNFGTNLELSCSIGEFRLTSDFGKGVPLLVGIVENLDFNITSDSG